MKTKNTVIGNEREFRYKEKLANEYRIRKEYREKKTQFMKDNKIIDLKNLMVFTYPKGFNKDGIFHLCIKTDDNKINFFNKETQVPIANLQSMEENLIKVFLVNQEDGDEIEYYSNCVEDLAQSYDFEGFMTHDSMDFIIENFENKELDILRYKDIEEIENKFVAMQYAQKNKALGQTEIEHFEK